MAMAELLSCQLLSTLAATILYFTLYRKSLVATHTRTLCYWKVTECHCQVPEYLLCISFFISRKKSFQNAHLIAFKFNIH
jgi:hypothetical protein